MCAVWYVLSLCFVELRCAVLRVYLLRLPDCLINGINVHNSWHSLRVCSTGSVRVRGQVCTGKSRNGLSIVCVCMCVSRFALAEAKMALARLYWDFRFELMPGQEPMKVCERVFVGFVFFWCQRVWLWHTIALLCLSYIGLAQTVYIRSIFVLFCAKFSKYTGYIYTVLANPSHILSVQHHCLHVLPEKRWAPYQDWHLKQPHPPSTFDLYQLTNQLILWLSNNCRSPSVSLKLQSMEYA